MADALRTDEPSSKWVSVFESGTDYEAELVRDRLLDSGIPAVVLTQRDHAFHLNVGSLAKVQVRVPRDRSPEARALLASGPIGDHELTLIALAADPSGPAAGEVTSAESPPDSEPESAVPLRRIKPRPEP